jgi:hypothetical protein
MDLFYQHGITQFDLRNGSPIPPSCSAPNLLCPNPYKPFPILSQFLNFRLSDDPKHQEFPELSSSSVPAQSITARAGGQTVFN